MSKKKKTQNRTVSSKKTASAAENVRQAQSKAEINVADGKAAEDKHVALSDDEHTCNNAVEQGNCGNKRQNVERQDSGGVEQSEIKQQENEQQDSGGVKQHGVEQALDELAAMPAPKRVWEVDFLRGFMILFVVWDHLMWDLRAMGPYNTPFFQALQTFAQDYDNGVLRNATHDVFVTLFVFTSGVSCSFSRSNGRRAIKMMSFALLFTAVTYALSAILSSDITIYFNVIHVIALSVLFWTVIEWVWSKCGKAWQKNVFGVVMTAVTVAALVVGACAELSPWTNDSPVWYFLAKHEITPGYGKFLGADFLPFLPDFGWFLVGAFLGRFVYKEKKSLFPSVNPKWVSPVTFCGRYSIWIYFGSQVVMFGLLYLLSDVANWL